MRDKAPELGENGERPHIDARLEFPTIRDLIFCIRDISEQG